MSEEALSQIAKALFAEITKTPDRRAHDTGGFADLENALDTIRRTAISRITATRRESNSRLRFHQLPTELFERILLAVNDAYSGWYRGIYRFVAVSAYWREVVESSPWFWRVLCSFFSKRFMDLVLTRSKNVPLVIYMIAAPYMGSDSMEALVSQAHRWEIATILNVDLQASRRLEQLHTPILKKLDIRGRGQPPWSPAQLFDGAMLPNLRSLVLTNLLDSFNPAHIAHITELTLGTDASPCIVSPKCIIGVLTHCPDLQSLSIICDEEATAELPALPLDIRLPELSHCHYVDIIAPHNISIPILISLRAPCRCLFVLMRVWEDRGAEWGSRLLEAMRNIECSIEGLVSPHLPTRLLRGIGTFGLGSDRRTLNLTFVNALPVSQLIEWLDGLLGRLDITDVTLTLEGPPDPEVASWSRITSVITHPAYGGAGDMLTAMSRQVHGCMFPNLKTLDMSGYGGRRGKLDGQLILTMLRTRVESPRHSASCRITEFKLDPSRLEDPEDMKRIQEYIQAGATVAEPS